MTSHADLRRVVVVGTSGAGKSTTGELLARRLGHPFVELDELFWSAGWQPKAPDEFRALVKEAAAGERWVVAGNYASARDVLWPRATDIVWLDLALPLMLARVVHRTFGRVLRREVLWHGNRESAMEALFTRKSIIWWTLTTHHQRRREFAEVRRSGRYPHLRWHAFTRAAAVDRFLGAIGTP